MHTDLLVVGGGFTGLWTALRAVERDPGLLGACSSRATASPSTRPAATAASARPASPTASPTGAPAGPTSTTGCTSSGLRNLDAIEETVERYGIDCGFARGGVLAVATRPHEVAHLEPDRPGLPGRRGRARASSTRRPTSPVATSPDGTAVVDPARLAWGLADAAEELGVRLHEHTRVLSVRRRGAGVEVTTGGR